MSSYSTPSFYYSLNNICAPCQGAAGGGAALGAAGSGPSSPRAQANRVPVIAKAAHNVPNLVAPQSSDQQQQLARLTNIIKAAHKNHQNAATIARSFSGYNQYSTRD